jgi:hypothetical protein
MVAMNELLEKALTLPADQREELARRLFQSLEGGGGSENLEGPPSIWDEMNEDEFTAEIDRRIAEAEANPGRERDADEVINELRAKFGLPRDPRLDNAK